MRTAKKAVTRVVADGLRVWKDVREDGGCSLYYAIDGLSVKSGELRGVRYSFESRAGSVGTPVLDQSGVRLGITWKGEFEDDPNAELAEVWHRMRRVSGEFRFKEPLRANRPAIAFGFTVSILNGHARNQWEYEQMYAPSKRHGIAGRRKPKLEYFPRIVSFEAKSLSVTLSLPDSITRDPVARVFESTRHPPAVDLHGMLCMDPVGTQDWRSVPTNTGVEVSKRAHNIWVMTVPEPGVGRCYSLAWELPPVKSNPLVRRAQVIRARLLRYARSRWNGMPGEKAVRDAFERLVRVFAKRYSGAGEHLEISLMTYDDLSHQLVVVDAWENGHFRGQIDENCQLPYGLGIAGACFKDGSQARLYIDPKDKRVRSEMVDGQPTAYVPFPISASKGRRQLRHKVLLALPVQVSDSAEESVTEERVWDDSRYCVAIVNLGTNRNETQILTRLESSDQEPDWLSKQCVQFASAFLNPQD